MLKYTENYIKINGGLRMANTKIIQRDERIEFIVSKQEKELIWKYAEELGIRPSRLIRNIVLMEAESKLRHINIATVKAYRKYLSVTDPEFLKSLEEGE